MASSGAQMQLKPTISNHLSSEDELKRICELGVAAFNDDDFAFVKPGGKEYRSHIAPDFVAQFDAHEKFLTFEELIGAFEHWYTTHPGFQCRYKHLTANVDEAAGTAIVHQELELTYEDIRQEALGESRFKRDASGRWMMHMYVGMRGIPGMGGFV